MMSCQIPHLFANCAATHTTTDTAKRIATHCNAHLYTRCKTLQHKYCDRQGWHARCRIYVHTATYVATFTAVHTATCTAMHTATHCNTHFDTRCNTMQHTHCTGQRWHARSPQYIFIYMYIHLNSHAYKHIYIYIRSIHAKRSNRGRIP